MFELEKVLVPIDFSDSSVIAASQAGVLARHFHSKVTLLHVNEFLGIHPLVGPLGYGIASWESIRSEHLAARQKNLDEFANAELSGISARRLVCTGDPAKLIVEHACADNSDLIIMPTHGRGAFRRFLLGSVTAKVLHDAGCPVWTGAHLAKTPELTYTVFRHVMCAVNFGPQSAKAVCWAADFATELGARLTVVHAVLETPPSLPDQYAFQWHDEAHRGANERLCTSLSDVGVQADALVVSDGDVPLAISAAVKDKRAGLLVIGRSCSGQAQRRLGSHAYNIICNAPCPVVSI